jgi:hypothetical protein
MASNGNLNLYPFRSALILTYLSIAIMIHFPIPHYLGELFPCNGPHRSPQDHHYHRPANLTYIFDGIGPTLGRPYWLFPSPYYPDPHSPGISCDEYLSLTGLEHIESCLAKLSVHPTSRFEAVNRYWAEDKTTSICSWSVDGVETTIELYVDDERRRARGKRMVHKWEVECALRAKLQGCAIGLIEGPGDVCEMTGRERVHVVFGRETVPDEEVVVWSAAGLSCQDLNRLLHRSSLRGFRERD